MSLSADVNGPVYIDIDHLLVDNSFELFDLIGNYLQFLFRNLLIHWQPKKKL